MGQSVADGHLPYVHLWDLKPPLLFYIFGLIEYLFPKSFIAIRFTGVLTVFLSSVVLFELARLHRLRNSFLIAICYIVVSSLFGSLQGLMSEHLSVLFMLLGLLIFSTRNNYTSILLAGICFGCGIMCKLNYGYGVAGLMLLMVLADWRQQQWIRPIVRNMVLAFGFLLPVALIAAPYYIQGQLDIFFDSVFLAPLAYVHAHPAGFLQKLERTWWVLLPSIFLSAAAFKKKWKQLRSIEYMTGVLLLTTVYTFYTSNRVNSHYLIQIYPFLLLILLGIIPRKTFGLKAGVLAVCLLLVSTESLMEYYRIFDSYRQQKTFAYRTTFQVMRELKQRNLQDKKILFANYHIAYWLLDQYPLTKSTTHPSNLSRPYLFRFFGASKSALSELDYLMNVVKPEVVVSSQAAKMDFLEEMEAEKKFYRSVIEKEYTLLYENNPKHIFIYKRK